MKRVSLAVLCLAMLCLAAPGRLRAEQVVFQGKSVCPIRCMIVWPFVRNPVQAGAVKADKGVAMAVSIQPESPAQEKSAVALGSDLRALRIRTVDARLGQPVVKDQPLLYYAMPPDRVIVERERLSRGQLTNLERALAAVNYQLAMQNQQQQELKKAVTLTTASSRTVRTATMDFESLLKKRDALNSAYEEAKARYADDLQLAHKRFGKTIDLRNFPRQESINACATGRVLWLNSSCVPGAVFTKETRLAIIGQMDPILVQAAVHEIAVHKLSVGDAATLTFASLPGQTFRTTIAKIINLPQPARSQEPSLYQVEMSLPNPDVRIKEGMRCDVSVTVPDGKRP